MLEVIFSNNDERILYDFSLFIMVYSMTSVDGICNQIRLSHSLLPDHSVLSLCAHFHIFTFSKLFVGGAAI